eukprot:snap_masked-scaffold_10-processed-gene-9.13-mRNA-1 protein AED:1.00 eAED:1.00 QI:0/-1/0/0/-1/1/1/0/74
MFLVLLVATSSYAHERGLKAPPCVSMLGQCGGEGYSGSGECCDYEANCVKYNEYYSQCIKLTASPTQSPVHWQV